MVLKTTTTVTDDINGKPGAATKIFSLEGTTYEIDLDPDNVQNLTDALGPFIKKARKPGSEPRKIRLVRMGHARAGHVGKARDVALTRAPAPVVTVVRPAAAQTPSAHRDPAAVREWARQNGYQVFDRGRLSRAAYAGYDRAHGL